MNGAVPRRVVVVGGGITGLTAAYRLAQGVAKDAKLRVDLIESGDRLGGKIFTDRVGEFLVEGGPDTWLARKPEAAALCRELGLEDRVIPTDPATRRAFVSRRGRLHRLPEGMSGLVPSRIGPLFTSALLSPRGRLRAAAEPLVPRGDPDAEESVAAFVRRRLGPEAYDYLVEPLLCGIYGGDGEQLSLDATAPALKALEAEHGSILKGMRVARRAEAREPAKYPTPFISLAGGVQELVDALIRQLQGCVQIQTYTDVVSVGRADGALELGLSTGDTAATAAVILATPAHAAAGLTAGLRPELSRALGEIPFVSSAAVWLGFREADAPGSREGYGYVVPRREGRMALACSWASTKLPGRAPRGHVLARVFLGRAGREIDDATADHDLVDLALDELGTTLGMSRRPLFARVYRYPRSMPQYTLGHPARVAGIERLVADTPGVFLAGNAYQGVGISDCIRSGQRAAFQALRHLDAVAA